jgi:MFS transporter, FHS family, glucose/mannose:H+ symporter
MATLPAQVDASSQEKRSLILAGQLAFLPTGILTTILGPMLPILIARWSLNDTQAGNLFLVQFLASVVGVQLSGVLLSRLGFRPAFIFGLLLMACGTVTLYTSSSLVGLASVAAYGLGLGLIIPTDNLLVAEISEGSDPSARSAAVSLLNVFWGVGAVLCSLLVAWSAAHHLLNAFLYSVAAFLIILAFAMRNLPFPAAETSSAAQVRWSQLLRNPVIWLFATVFFLYPGAETAVGGWIGSYVSRLSARGAELASVMPAFYWSALTVGRAAGTAFLRHFSERFVLRAVSATGAAGIGLMLWAPSLIGVIAGALVTGLSYATLYPITVARFSHRFGVAARSIGAIMFSLASLGPAILPWMVGVVSQRTNSLRAGLLLPLGATVILFIVHLTEW